MPEDLLSQQAQLFLGILTVLEEGLRQDCHTSTSPLVPALFPLEIAPEQH